MKISGFSFVRNGIKLYYPIVESLRSLLPLCDEVVVAVGQGDPDDTTREEILALDDPKIRVIDTVWEEQFQQKGAINAIQTDIALRECSGDWCFYLQADEVVHERSLPVIQKRCEQLLADERVEGLLFDYRHFWGDYNHCHNLHGWYPREIRIIRNLSHIHSWQSAQSFRSFEKWEHPRQPQGTRKLQVAPVDAEIFHYGWVRPPHLMQNKRRALDSVHWGRGKAQSYYDKAPTEFDYGPLDRVPRFLDTHPAVMQEMIARMDWQEKLQLNGKPDPGREPHKHERLKYRLLTWIEQQLMGGRQLGGFRNYELAGDYE